MNQEAPEGAGVSTSAKAIVAAILVAAAIIGGAILATAKDEPEPMVGFPVPVTVDAPEQPAWEPGEPTTPSSCTLRNGEWIQTGDLYVDGVCVNYS